MDAFMVAEELLGDIELTSGQLAGLRAINHDYFTQVYALLHPADEHDAVALPGTHSATHVGAPALTDEQSAMLRAMVERHVLELLTPLQRAELDAR